MKKNFLKSTIVVVAVAASSFGAWKAYDAYGVTDNTLLEENIDALADGDRSGWFEGWTDPCVRVCTGTKKERIYDSVSSSNDTSTSTSNSVGGNYNPVTQGVGGNISNSNSVSNGGSFSGQCFIGEAVDCDGWSFSHCHLGDCTKYERGKGFVPTYPDCAKKLNKK